MCLIGRVHGAQERFPYLTVSVIPRSGGPVGRQVYSVPPFMKLVLSCEAQDGM